MTPVRRVRPAHRFALLACLFAIAFATTGCQTVPIDGPVGHMELEQGRQASAADTVVNDVRPEPDQSRTQVVQGFLEAMASYQPQYPMARQFLTPEQAAEWRPEAGMLIYDEPAVVPSDKLPGRVVLSGSKVGEIGADGGWVPAEPDTEARAEFDLKRIDGQWRIDRAPDAVLTTENYFEREYYPVNLYFFDPEFQVLAPDPVYLPARGNPETLIVKALLRGPTRWLSSVVRTAIPAGTRMQSPSVTIEGQTAQIDLSEQVRLLNEGQRRMLMAQLIWTLREVVRIDRVNLTVDQVPLDIPETGWENYAPSVADASATPYIVVDRQIQMLSGGKLEPAVERLPFVPKDLAVAVVTPPAPDEPNRPGVGRPVDRLAVVPKNGRSVWTYGIGQTEPHQVGDGEFDFHNVRSVSWDRGNRLWVVDTERRQSRIVIVDDTGEPQEIRAPGLAGRDVRALKVSRDGTRIAALVQKDTGQPATALVVGLVNHDERTSIRDVRELPIDFTTASDVVWSDVAELLVLGRVADEPSGLATVSVDGASVDPVNDVPTLATVAVAAAPNQPLLVVTSEHDLARPETAFGWMRLGPASLPAYPG